MLYSIFWNADDTDLRNFENVIPLTSLRVFCICEAKDLQIQNVSRTDGVKSFL